MSRCLILGAAFCGVFPAAQASELTDIASNLALTPEVVLLQLQGEVGLATEALLPQGQTIFVGDSGLVFPPLTLPSPIDPAFLGGLPFVAPEYQVFDGWDAWRGGLFGVIEADVTETDGATAAFIDVLNAAVAQAVYRTTPSFDLLSIYQADSSNEAASADQGAAEDTASAGFFFR